MRLHPLTFVFVLSATVGCANASAPKTPSVLPLRTLRLYETGVGYFERAGSIADATATSLPVPAGHLDDALKSLVILNNAAGGQVTGLSFATSVSKGVARSRAGLPVDVDQPITYHALLVSLKGEQVEVATADGPILARLIEVTEEPEEPAPAPKEDTGARARAPRMVAVITLLTDKGEIEKLKGREIGKVRPIDPAFAGRLSRALDALSTRSAQNNRPLSLLGDARGSITFGYIAETPIWRTTYRLLVTPEGNAGTLQGWALVHNDTDESWQRIGLSLVNGQPDSFLFPLAAPRYLRRAMVHPEEALSTIPQLQDQTPDTMWGDHADSNGGAGYAVGYGAGHGRLGGSHRTSPPTIRMGATTVSDQTIGRSALLAVGNLASIAIASGVENAALFTYTVDKPFSLDARSSALVPFMSTKVEIETLAWFSAADASARAAVRFTNTTGQTLPAGTLAVFASGGFIGETTLDRLKPGERRFVQIGNELDVEVSHKKTTTHEEHKRLTFDSGRLEEHFLRKSQIAYELENRGGAPRALYVGLRVDRNASIKGADGVDLDEEGGSPVVIFKQPAKQKVIRSFEVTEGLSRSTRVDALTESHLREVAQHASLPAGERAIAAEAAGKLKEAEAATKAVEVVKREITSIDTDVQRFREHLKALGGDKGGGGGAAAPLVKRLLEGEDKLAAAHKRREAAEKDRTAKLEAVRVTLAKLGPAT